MIALCDNLSHFDTSTASSFFFYFTDTPPPEIYTLSLHDALPISLHPQQPPPPRRRRPGAARAGGDGSIPALFRRGPPHRDRKSTRLNSSHRCISYAVFCLKKKKIKNCTSYTPTDIIRIDRS